MLERLTIEELKMTRRLGLGLRWWWIGEFSGDAWEFKMRNLSKESGIFNINSFGEIMKRWSNNRDDNWEFWNEEIGIAIVLLIGGILERWSANFRYKIYRWRIFWYFRENRRGIANVGTVGRRNFKMIEFSVIKKNFEPMSFLRSY